jgi:hypothetical protein
MSGIDIEIEQENPVCLDADLPTPPEIRALGDPSVPHPDEPGAPHDAPEVRRLSDTHSSSS